MTETLIILGIRSIVRSSNGRKTPADRFLSVLDHQSWGKYVIKLPVIWLMSVKSTHFDDLIEVR